ncbi:metal ABC transporter permease [Aureibacter tunicatorum]|uniref:Manganese/zinc/iron transport system permease protein n=1 Tax=Aureibacter tunicatorum TaxID=866807 RepID=A0AAE3XLR7_9BACT|nr:metal ABC transporter permease [Aureibacter tunicatorum]MDR6238908.1 manganese/zinc/iron transport system permease protein [Aureibacter tunicatorum]BDD05165.1 zinc ABC transporter permease [Aureibacter tunicatorum]
MTIAQIEIQLVAAIVAAACAIPGTFLVLRKMAMISDAISHSILPGIVIGFFITHDINSPLLILLAAMTGVLTVVLVEFIQKTGLVKEDTAIGLVFPALFSIGVLMIAQKANDIHLDVDAVLVGELAFTPFDRMIISGMDLGPKAMWISGSILIFSIILLSLFFKEIKISTFDPQLAATLGFSPAIIHHGLMAMASVTTVGAFDAVGAILVVALMIAPAAAAYLLTDDLIKMLVIAVAIGVSSAIAGYWTANLLDASIAGAITTVLGLIFFITFLLAPNRGWISIWQKRRKQKVEVSMLTLLLHLNNHSDKNERTVNHLNEHINWQKARSKKVLAFAQKNNMINIEEGIVNLTTKGELFANEAINLITDSKSTAIENMKEDFFLFRA